MNYRFWILLISVGFLFVKCSTPLPIIGGIEKTEESIYKNDLKINSKRIYAWIDKMPGADSKPRLHVTGELDFFDDTHYNIEKIAIKKISIIQNDELIYLFSPSTEVKFEGEKKVILFSNIKGLLVSAQLNTEENITLKLLLSDGEENIDFFIPDVKINEVF